MASKFLKGGDYSPSLELRFCGNLEYSKSITVSVAEPSPYETVSSRFLSLETQPPGCEELYPAERSCPWQALPAEQVEEEEGKVVVSSHYVLE